MQIIETHTVPKLNTPVRLQEYAVGIFMTVATKSALKKAIKKNLVSVNGILASTALYIHGGETISLLESPEQIQDKKLKLDLEIIYEDNYLAVINKPPGIVVSGNRFVSIDNALVQNLKKSTESDATRPRPVHRLDYPTSGLLLIGKTSSVILTLNKLFEQKKIQKTYHAVTIGKMDSRFRENDKGEISLPVDQKEALSEYTVVRSVASSRFEFLNLVKLSPKTGRKHQLRKHLSAIGNPILGDREYGIEGLILKGKGLYLHASALEFTHPFTKEEMSIYIDLPGKFVKIFP